MEEKYNDQCYKCEINEIKRWVNFYCKPLSWWIKFVLKILSGVSLILVGAFIVLNQKFNRHPF
jgi:hypothetical protein